MHDTIRNRVRTPLAGESARYLIKSVGGLGVGLALLTIWVEWFNIRPELAIFINFVVIGLVGCVVLDRWVFSESEPATTIRGFGRRFVGMQGAMLSAKAVNYVFFVALIDLGLFYQAAWTAGAVVSFLISFVLNRWWFRGQS